MSSILLSTAYFAPIQYYSKFVKFESVYIEQFENFNKQTYRNRCKIMGGNGPIMLIVPVVKGRGPKILIKNMKISSDTDWKRNHWRTIFSAYNSSPYFEYYADEIRPFFEKNWKFLFDFNLAIHKTMTNLLELDEKTILTEDFEKAKQDTVNFREFITPKVHRAAYDEHFHQADYTQVFSERFGFVPNLSILDLLFNEGPNSYSILEASIR